MEARLVRDELTKCHRHEGVNHLENCRWLSDKYITMLKENKVRDMHTSSSILLNVCNRSRATKRLMSRLSYCFLECPIKLHSINVVSAVMH